MTAHSVNNVVAPRESQKQIFHSYVDSIVVEFDRIIEFDRIRPLHFRTYGSRKVLLKACGYVIVILFVKS